MGTQWQVSQPGAFEAMAGSPSFLEIISVLAEEDRVEQSSPWDRVLGLVTIAAISAAGWMAIIALARLLRSRYLS
jgi:hypothetical protein